MMWTTISVLAGLVAAQDYSQPDFTHDEGLPWCDMIQFSGEHEDCALVLEDGRVLEFDYTANGAEDEWGDSATALTVTLHTRAGRALQTIEETVGRTFGYPEISDIDNDGDEELMIATYTGNVNTTWSVWQQTPDGFVAAGEVGGLSLEYNEDTGFATISSRGSASSWSIEAYQLTADGLVSVYTLNSDLYTMNCSVDEGPAFAGSGLDAAAMEAECEDGMGEEE